MTHTVSFIFNNDRLFHIAGKSLFYASVFNLVVFNIISDSNFLETDIHFYQKKVRSEKR